jgi:hypothetical protein
VDDLLEGVPREKLLLLDLLGDLGELGQDEEVGLVTGSVQSGEGGESLLGSVDLDEPSLERGRERDGSE